MTEYHFKTFIVPGERNINDAVSFGLIMMIVSNSLANLENASSLDGRKRSKWKEEITFQQFILIKIEIISVLKKSSEGLTLEEFNSFFKFLEEMKGNPLARFILEEIKMNARGRPRVS